MAINVASGRWGLSLIIEEEPLAFTTSALLNGIASGGSDCHYPPLNPAKTGYAFPYALTYSRGTVANDANTFFIPRNIDPTGTIGDLNNPQRNAVRNFFNTNFTGYTYTDWDGTIVNVPAFNFDAYPLSTPLVELIRALFAYLGNSEYRPKPALPESHNTEYTDNFDSDSSSSWTNDGSFAYVRNATDGELQQSSIDNDARLRYSANTPGSIEHETQCTVKMTNTSGRRTVFSGIRMYGTGDDAYGMHIGAEENLLQLSRFNGGTRTTLTTHTITTINASDWATHRYAASGTAGSNVVLDTWWTDHGTTKPSNPGWIGSDGSPDFTYTDSSASRLDDSTHDSGGLAGRGPVGDYGARVDFWKVRALSDRGGLSQTVGQTTETDTAQAISLNPIRRLVGQPVETDTAQAVARLRTKLIGQALETDTAQAISALITLVLGQATEADTAQTIAPTKTFTIGQATEADAAQNITRVKRLSVGQVTETDLAQLISVSGNLVVTVNQTVETDVAQAIARAKRKALGQSTETDLSQAITARKTKALGQVTESDIAQAMTFPLRRLAGQATETDLAQVIASGTLLIPVNLVTETDAAGIVTVIKLFVGWVPDSAVLNSWGVAVGASGIWTPDSPPDPNLWS